MNDFRLYFTNGTVYVKSELCYRDLQKQAYRYLNQSIDCNLSPTKNVYFFNRDTLIELCLIEIYGKVLTHSFCSNQTDELDHVHYTQKKHVSLASKRIVYR